MSEQKKCEVFSLFDSMSTEKLQEILRKHACGELETEVNIQDLLHIMEILSNRRQQQEPHAFRSSEEAFDEFLKYYMPQENE